MLTPELEFSLLEQSYSCVVGIDEAGRGAWAGPVAVGFYVYNQDSLQFNGVKDSKQISPSKREVLFDSLLPQGGVVLREPSYIDEHGIGEAISDCIEEVMALFPAAYFLVDGQFSRKFPAQYRCIIKGDSTVYSIAAASILAKVARDRAMLDLDKQYPGYGFGVHKGYGTKFHAAQLEKLLPSKEHRHSYAPVKKLLEIH